MRLLFRCAAFISESPLAKDLITHLLCVDPKQRYTIDEFLQHEWCLAAPTEPAPPTPAARHVANAPLDSPLLQAYMRGERDGRSPGISSLKEAFDITYAVHRMEEEGAHRRARGRDRQVGITGGRWLPGLNEEDEGGDDQRLIQEARRKRGEVDILDTSIKRKGERRGEPRAAKVGASGPGKPGFDARAGQRDANRRAFELDMQGATLLGRRNKRAAGGVGSPLTQPPLFANTLDAPQSPMQVI